MTAQPGEHDGSPRMFDLNRPQGFAKDEYLFSFTHERDVVFDIIRSNRNQSNINDIITSVQFAISLIAHDDVRRKQEYLFFTALDYVNSMTNHNDDQILSHIRDHIQNNGMSVEEKARIILKLCRQNPVTNERRVTEMLRVCSTTMGNLTAYVDQFRGLAHKLKVGELYNFEKKYGRKERAFDSNLPESGSTDIIRF